MNETPANEDLMRRYTEIIIDHSQFPRHHQTLRAPTHEGHGENPFCGDRVQVQLRIDANDTIEAVAVESLGCAICIASGSLLASHLQGLPLAAAEKLFLQVRRTIMEGTPDASNEPLGELAALSFASRYPARVKCATLPWHVLKHALAGDVSVASTE